MEKPNANFTLPCNILPEDYGRWFTVEQILYILHKCSDHVVTCKEIVATINRKIRTGMISTNTYKQIWYCCVGNADKKSPKDTPYIRRSYGYNNGPSVFFLVESCVNPLLLVKETLKISHTPDHIPDITDESNMNTCCVIMKNYLKDAISSAHVVHLGYKLCIIDIDRN